MKQEEKENRREQWETKPYHTKKKDKYNKD